MTFSHIEQGRSTNGPSDDLVIGQLTTALFTGPALLLAHELGLFAALEDKPLSAKQLGEKLSLQERAVEALLLTGTAAGLLTHLDEGYALSGVGRDYLLRSSPTQWCGYLDYLVQHPELFSYQGLRGALLSDKPQLHRGEDLFAVQKQND